MKNCPPGEIISRYLDGELEAGESARLEAHLDSCPRCRKKADRLERAGDLIRLAVAGGPPPPARLGRMIEEKFFPRPPEVLLGMIEFDLSALDGPPARRPRSDLSLAAERPPDYVPGPGAVGDRRCRRALSGEGIEAAVEIFRGAEGSAACRVAVRDRAGKPLAGVRLQLEKEGKPVWSFLTRGPKESVIPRLLPGRYRLRIEHGRTYSLILGLR
jgi:anti-sigma factor RsiW